MRNKPFKLIAQLAGLAALSAIFLYFFSTYVPFNMDEFAVYHALACQEYPLNKYNTFRESCAIYDLAPLGEAYLPLRSSPYMGSFFGLLYYHLFKLWPAPYSARLLGLIILAMQAVLLNRIFKVNFLFSFLSLLLFMPYAFGHIADTGPVCFPIFSVFLVCYLAQKWAKSLEADKKYSVIFPVSIGGIIFLGIWHKLFYFSLLPGILVLIFYFTGKLKAKLIKQSAFIFLIPAALSFILFNSAERTHRSHATRGGTSFITPYNPDKDNYRYSDFLFTQAKNLKMFSQIRLAGYLINPLLSTHRIFKARDLITLKGTVWFSVVILLLFFGIRSLRAEKIE